MKRRVSRREMILGPLLWGGAAALGLASGRAQAAPERLTERFLAAAAAGDRDAVRYLLDLDPSLLRVSGADGRTAFTRALLGRQPPVAELLRARGYEPDLHESALALDWERFESLAAQAPEAVDADHPIGGPAMVAAALGGAGSSIWRVYAAGGHPGERGASDLSALAAALGHPDLGVAEMTAASLLANGAGAAARSRGTTPLHLAARRGSVELVEMLLRKGAEVEALDSAGRTARQIAETEGHHEAAARLERHHEIVRDHSTSRWAWDAAGRPYSPPDLSRRSPLETGRVVGAAHFDLEATRQLLERDPALVHAVATTTEGAVEGCAHTGRREIVDFLLERGAPYSLPTAVMRGDIAWTRRLLAEDPLRVHERGPHDFALLWYPVIGGGHLELADLLLAAGAEVERQHFLGTTALHFAALRGQAEMAELLLDHGADPGRIGRKFDASGQTPLDLALSRDRREVASLLRSRGAA